MVDYSKLVVFRCGKSMEWWKEEVIIQLYPRSFQDTNQDGVGDLRGVIRRLDYLSTQLGVGALWLSPVQMSPQKDFGYDVSNYCDIDPLFGDMEDMHQLIDKAHQHGMKVILDGVFNHTSDQHPWFLASRASRQNAYRDWYLWSPGQKPPNNWAAAFGGSAWSYDQETDSCYLHSFSPQQPDLNWSNPAVKQAVLQSMKFWLDLGIDGFRLDVFNCYCKDPILTDNPYRQDLLGRCARWVYPFLGQHHVADRDQPELLAILREMRQLVGEERVLIGETLDERFLYDNAAQYVSHDLLHLGFHFRLLHSKWGADSFLQAIRAWVDALGPKKWPTWVVSNHDFPRIAKRWGREAARLRLVALLLMTLRGTPVLYYGDEIGMREARLKRSQIVDPPGQRFWPFFRGRDGCRTPMQWNADHLAGFSRADSAWLPVNQDYLTRNVRGQQQDTSSIWHGYRAAIALRKQHVALREGEMLLPTEVRNGVLTFLRIHPKQHIRVLINMRSKAVEYPLQSTESFGHQLYTTHTGRHWNGTLLPFEGVVLELTDTDQCANL